MPFSSSILYFLISIPFVVVFSSNAVPHSYPKTSKPSISCGPRHDELSVDLKHTSTFNRTMNAIEEQISKEEDRFWAFSSGNDESSSTYVLLQCRVDKSISSCQHCLAKSRKKLEKHCAYSISGQIHHDECFLRFDYHDFSTEYVNDELDQVECGENTSSNRTRDHHDDDASYEFLRVLDEAFVNMTIKAVKNEGFGAAVQRDDKVVVYALAQCRQNIHEDSCQECLVNARARLKKCHKTEAKAFLTGCYMRYSSKKFFDDAAQYKTRTARSRTEILSLASIVGFLSALGCLGICIGYIRFSRKRRESKSYCSNFKYETLEKATDFFHNSRKLGQGGAGSVYKGNLPDGRVVAVKRLFFNTRQWTDQFFNEVNLLSGIRHKNLVRLLGASIEGPESLLVYEYVPNRSLDQILFVKNTVHILSWRQRFSIIVGIAVGLEHLHGGSGVKIIHRDIKTGNILLDQNLNPKISDFGLARSVGHDKSHTSTGIAGTLGYMAPEYLIRGQLTEKTDVYAFGVLIIEVATGKKNSALTQGSNSVLYSVWKHYSANTLSRSVDPRLRERYFEEEATKVLQIGLLCVQSSVALRPTMSEIVWMLKNEDCLCPNPEQPPFLSATYLMGDEDNGFSNVLNA